MEKRKPSGRLVVCNREGEKEYRGIIALWEGKYGQNFTIDGRLTRDEWIQIWDDMEAKKLWGNVYTEDEKPRTEAPF